MNSKISTPDTDGLKDVTDLYTYRITPLIQSQLDDPYIARQYLPDKRELINYEGEHPDPIGDEAHSPVKGIVHRYADRVLLKPHHACAVYCRFCFRKDMVGRKGEVLGPEELEQALEYIRNNAQIWEVILTGGDPMALSARRLSSLLSELNKIDHLKSIRIHTRVPIVAPELVTDQVLSVLEHSEKALSMSLHCNHANEITSSVSKIISKLRKSGVMLVSQSVLLKSINDNVSTLESLFRKLVENGVKPYYLHHPDKAPGTRHFSVSIKDGLEIYQQLRGRLSGLCIPHYMLDLPGGFGKVPLDSTRVQFKKNHAEITDHRGVVHIYKD